MDWLKQSSDVSPTQNNHCGSYYINASVMTVEKRKHLLQHGWSSQVQVHWWFVTNGNLGLMQVLLVGLILGVVGKLLISLWSVSLMFLPIGCLWSDDLYRTKLQRNMTVQVTWLAWIWYNSRTGSVPCDREGALGGPRSGPLSADFLLLLQRVVVRGW